MKMQGVLELKGGLPQGDVTQRAIWWSFQIDQLLMGDVDFLMSLPDEANLIILPSDDPELCNHNLALARQAKGPQVMVQLERRDDTVVLTPYAKGKPHTFRAAV